MQQIVNVTIDQKGNSIPDSKSIGLQYETGVTRYAITPDASWVSDQYFYYIIVSPPEDSDNKQYAVPLVNQGGTFIFEISSGITWHVGNYKFAFLSMSKPLVDGQVPNDGVVGISESWNGKITKSILDYIALQKQPEDANFQLLYTDLMALSVEVRNKSKYAQEQGDYAKEQGNYAKTKTDELVTQAQYAAEQGNYAKEQGNNAYAQAEEAKAQAEYAKTQGGYAKEQGEQAQAQGKAAQEQGAYAETQGRNAQEQSQYAKTQGDYANEEGNKATLNGTYAKEQGDYTKTQGDYAKTQGNYAKEQGNYANEQGTYAKEQGGNANKEAENAKTQAEYAREQGHYAKDIGDNLEGKINRLYANQPKGTASGTEVVVQDSAEMESVLKLSGNSEQETRSGKNKFNNTYSNLALQRVVLNENSGLVAGQSYLSAYCKVESGKTYSISKSKVTARFIVAFCNEIPTVNSTVLVYTSQNSEVKIEKITIPQGYSYLYILLSNSGESSEGLNLQIEEGTVATPYEPYGVQPSPDYPSEIRSVSGDVEVKVEGKNKLDKNAFDNPSINLSASYNKATHTITFLGDTNTANGIFIKLGNHEIGKTYTFSCYIKGPAKRQPIIGYAGKNQYPVLTGDWQRYSETITAEAETNTLIIYSNYPTGGGMQNGDMLQIKDWQLEESPTTTPYVPYVEPTTVQLPLGDIELRSTPDGTRDTFERVDGKWNKRNNVFSEIFDGSNDDYISKNPYGTNSYKMLILHGKYLIDKDKILTVSNRFTSKSYNDRTVDIANILYTEQESSIDHYVTVRNTNFTTLEEYKTYLANNPLHVIYPLATPTYTPITDQALISALDELEQLILHKGYNYITATSVNGVKAQLDLSYIKDINIVLNNMSAMIMAIGGELNV